MRATAADAVVWDRTATPHDYYGSQAVPLPDGRIFIVYAQDEKVAFFDPVTQAFSDGPTLGGTWPDWGPQPALLSDGRVLLPSGQSNRGRGIFDPVLNSWTTVPLAPVEINEGVVTLENGTVLALSGSAASAFDATTETWSTPITLSAGGWIVTAAPLDGGRALVVGHGASGVLDAVAGTWTPVPQPSLPDLSYGTAVRLSDGRVLLTGEGDQGFHAATYSDIFDPATATWASTAALPDWVAAPRLLALPDGRVLATVGVRYSNQVHNRTWFFDTSAQSWSAGPKIYSATGLSWLVMGAAGPVGFEPAYDQGNPAAIERLVLESTLPAPSLKLEGDVRLGEGNLGERPNLAPRIMNAYDAVVDGDKAMDLVLGRRSSQPVRVVLEGREVTAQNGDDFVPFHQEVVIPADTARVHVPLIRVVGDVEPEGDESFDVAVVSVDGATLSGVESRSVTIVDDDGVGPRQGVNELASFDDTNRPVVGGIPTISRDGRLLAYAAADQDYFPDCNASLFVRDRLSGISTSIWPPERWNCDEPTVSQPIAFSADGTRLAFSTTGINTNAAAYRIADLTTGVSELIPFDAGDGWEVRPQQYVEPASLSGDGRSFAYRVIARPNGASEFDTYLVVRNLVTGVVRRFELVSDPVLNDNGTKLLVKAGYNVPGPLRAELIDVASGAHTVASIRPDGSTGSAGRAIGMSSDARWVMFEEDHVYVRDMQAGTTSNALPTVEDCNPDNVGVESLSANGRYLAFACQYVHNDPGLWYGDRRIFVRDLVAGTTSLASTAPDGSPVPDSSDVNSGEYGASAYGAMIANNGTTVFSTNNAGSYPGLPEGIGQSMLVHGPQYVLSAAVPAGGSLSTARGVGVSPTDPIVAQVTSPNAGTISFKAGNAQTDVPFSYDVAGSPFVIEAPAASRDAPLSMHFIVDATRHDGTAKVLRDGVPIPSCVTPGHADPAPCVASSFLNDEDDLDVTILSDHASSWAIGMPNGRVIATPKISVTPSPLVADRPQEVKVSVVGSPGYAWPTGEVEFFDGATSLGRKPIVDGAATISTNLSPGGHTLRARYLGDTMYRPSRAGALFITVLRGEVALRAFPAIRVVSGKVTLLKFRGELKDSAGVPIAGAKLTMRAHSGNTLCVATTNASGIGECTTTAPDRLVKLVLGLGYVVAFDGDTYHFPASTNAPIVALPVG